MTIHDVWPQAPKPMSEYEYCHNEIPGVGRNDIPDFLNKFLLAHKKLFGV
jgi:hypothetical protein